MKKAFIAAAAVALFAQNAGAIIVQAPAVEPTPSAADTQAIIVQRPAEESAAQVLRVPEQPVRQPDELLAIIVQ